MPRLTRSGDNSGDRTILHQRPEALRSGLDPPHGSISHVGGQVQERVGALLDVTNPLTEFGKQRVASALQCLLFDKVSVIRRALTDDKVRALHVLEGGVATLHP